MDITMCKGRGCPIKKDCKRHNGIINEFWQAFFEKEPCTGRGSKFKCEMFWSEKNNQTINQVKDILNGKR